MKIFVLGKKCFSYFVEYIMQFIAEIIMKILQIAISLMIVFVLSKIFGLITNGEMVELKSNIFLLTLCYVVYLVLGFFQFELKQRIEKNIRVNTKKDIMFKILQNYIEVNQKGMNIDSSRITEIIYTDINNITTYVYVLSEICMAGIMLIVIAVILFKINFKLSLILFVWCVITGFWVYLYSKKLKKINRRLRSETDRHFKLARDILNNLKYICISNSRAHFFSKYEKNIESVKDMTAYRDKKAWILGYISSVFDGVWIILLLIYSISRIQNGKLGITEVVLFLSYAKIYSNQITKILNQLAYLQQVMVSVERVFELTDTYNIEKYANGKFPSQVSNIDISEIYFNYKDKKIFEDFNKKIMRHGIVITGKNGRGKTTLLNLMSGFLSPDSGNIFINDIPLHDMSIDSILRAIAYAPQGDVIFDMSIRENILSFDGADQIEEAQLWEMCREFQLLDDILGLEKKFETILSESQTLSFGQKKKISLIRTCLRTSKIVLLDEPLEGLDKLSQEKVVKYILSLSQQKYVIVATHRPEQFSGYDEIVSL